jgi:hypothetical protein
MHYPLNYSFEANKGTLFSPDILGKEVVVKHNQQLVIS